MDSSSSSRHGRGFIPYISVTIAMGSYDRSLAFKPATDLGAVSKAVTEMESDVDPSNRSALSSSPSTTKLIAFPFTRLPIELQLEVGKQTLTFSHAIEIFVLTPRERTLMLENKFHYMQHPFAMAQTAARFHLPLMRYFFSTNEFDLKLFVSEQDCLDALRYSIGATQDYFRFIRYLSVTYFALISRKTQFPTFAPYLFTSLRKLEIRWDPFYHDDQTMKDIELIKERFEKMFAKVEGLKVVTFRNGEVGYETISHEGQSQVVNSWNEEVVHQHISIRKRVGTMSLWPVGNPVGGLVEMRKGEGGKIEKRCVEYERTGYFSSDDSSQDDDDSEDSEEDDHDDEEEEETMPNPLEPHEPLGP